MNRASIFVLFTNNRAPVWTQDPEAQFLQYGRFWTKIKYLFFMQNQNAAYPRSEECVFTDKTVSFASEPHPPNKDEKHFLCISPSHER